MKHKPYEEIVKLLLFVAALLYGGQILQNSSNLLNYGIEAGVTVHAIKVQSAIQTVVPGKYMNSQ